MVYLKDTLNVENGICSYQLARIRLNLGEIKIDQLTHQNYKNIYDKYSSPDIEFIRRVRGEDGSMSLFYLMHSLLNIIGVQKDKENKKRYPDLIPIFNIKNLWTKGTAKYISTEKFENDLKYIITVVNEFLRGKNAGFSVPRNIYKQSFSDIITLYDKIENNKNFLQLPIIEINDQRHIKLNDIDGQINLLEGVDEDSIASELKSFSSNIGKSNNYLDILGEFFAYFTGDFDMLNGQILRSFFTPDNIRKTLPKVSCVFLCDISQTLKDTALLTNLINAVRDKLEIDPGLDTELADSTNLYLLKNTLVEQIFQRAELDNILFVLYATHIGGEPRPGELNLTFDRSEIELLMHDICWRLHSRGIKSGAIIGLHGAYSGYKSTTSRKISIPPVSKNCWIEYCEDAQNQKGEINTWLAFSKKVLSAVPDSTISNASIRGLFVISKLLDTQSLLEAELEYWEKEFIIGFAMNKFPVRIIKFLTEYFIFMIDQPNFFFLLIALGYCNDGLTKDSLLFIAKEIDPSYTLGDIDNFLDNIGLLVINTPLIESKDTNNTADFEYEIAEPIRHAIINYAFVYFEDSRYNKRYINRLSSTNLTRKEKGYISKQEIHFIIAKRSLYIRQEMAEKTAENSAPEKVLLRYELVGMQNLLLALPISNYPKENNINYHSLEELYSKILSCQFNEVSKGELVNTAWKIFYHQIDNQRMNPYTDQYFPDRSKCHNQLKGEMLKLFFSCGQSFISRHFFLPQLLINCLDGWSIQHLYNAAGMYYWYANDYENIRKLYQSYRVYFEHKQEQSPSAVIGNLAEIETLSFYSRRSVSRVGSLHLLELSEGGQLRRVRNLGKWYLEDLSSLGKECVKALSFVKNSSPSPKSSQNGGNTASQIIHSDEIELLDVDGLTQKATKIKEILLSKALLKVMQKIIYYHSEIALQSMRMGNFEAAFRFLINISRIYDSPLNYLMKGDSNYKNVNSFVKQVRGTIITEKSLVNIIYALIYFVGYQSSVNTSLGNDNIGTEVKPDYHEKGKAFTIYGGVKISIRDLIDKEKDKADNGDMEIDTDFFKFMEEVIEKAYGLLIEQKNKLDEFSKASSIQSNCGNLNSIKIESLWHLYNILSLLPKAENKGLLKGLSDQIKELLESKENNQEKTWQETNEQLTNVGFFRSSKHFRLLQRLNEYRLRIKNLQNFTCEKVEKIASEKVEKIASEKGMEDQWEKDTLKDWTDNKYWFSRLTIELENNGQLITLIDFLMLKFWHVVRLTQATVTFKKPPWDAIEELLQEQSQLEKTLSDLIGKSEYEYRRQDLQYLLQASLLSIASYQVVLQSKNSESGCSKNEIKQEIQDNKNQIELLLNKAPICMV